MSDHLTDVERRARWQESELQAEVKRLRAENAELREQLRQAKVYTVPGGYEPAIPPEPKS